MSTSASSRSAAPPAGAGQSRQSSLDRRRRARARERSEKGERGLVDVFAATLPTLKFIPGVHVNYAETVLPMRDGLPKFKDFPVDFGGSGGQIAE